MKVPAHVVGEKRQKRTAGAESEESCADYQIGEMIVVGDGKSPDEYYLESENRNGQQEDRTGQPACHPVSAACLLDRARHGNKPHGHQLPGRDGVVPVFLHEHQDLN